MDCGMCVNKDMSPLIASILSKEVPPTEAEVVRTRLVRERKARGWKAEDLTDEHFEGRTDDEAAVAEYFMAQPMNDALNALLRIFPQTEGGRPELARKLGKLYRDRCENYVYLKKQAKQAPNGKLQPNLKLHKECVLKAIELAEQTDRFFFDIINEVRWPASLSLSLSLSLTPSHTPQKPNSDPHPAACQPEGLQGPYVQGRRQAAEEVGRLSDASLIQHPYPPYPPSPSAGVVVFSPPRVCAG